MSKWFVLVGEQQKGPLTEDDLKACLRNHDPTEVWVWREGFEDWRLARDIPELVRTVRPSPPLIAVREASVDVASTELVGKTRKGKWAKIGSLVGLLLVSINLVNGSGASGSANAAFYIGYVGGGVFFAALIGFVFGAIADLVRGQANNAAKIIEAKQVSPTSRNFMARHWRGELPLWVSYWGINFLGNLLIGTIPILITATFKSDSGRPRYTRLLHSRYARRNRSRNSWWIQIWS